MINHLKLIALSLFLSYTYLTAENMDKSSLEFYKHEKLRIPVERILEKINNPGIVTPEQKNKSDKQQFGYPDAPVSTANEMESEVSAAINPTDSNNIIVSPINNSGYGMYCPVYYTTDFGASWEKSNFNNDTRIEKAYVMGGGDPVLIYDADGRAYMTWIHLVLTVEGMNPDSVFMATYWAYSDDGGQTWIRENNDLVGNTLTKAKYDISGINFTALYDKEWLACDHSNSEYRNNLYMSTTYIGINEDVQGARIKVYTKPSDAQTFNEEGVVVAGEEYDQVQFSMIDVDNEGTLHIVFFGQKNGESSLYHSKSTDGGQTFSEEVKISNFYGVLSPDRISVTGIPNERLFPSPYLAVDKSNSDTDGDLYFTWSANGIDNDENSGKNVYFSKSTDGGARWSDPIIINNSESGIVRDCYYPSLAVSDEGVVIVTWYDRNNDPDNIHAEYYIAYSFDGGKSFTSHNPISSEKTNFSDLVSTDFGIGEYNQIVATKGYAIPVWGDGRKNNGDVDIYCAFVPITPDLSPVDEIVHINPDFYLSEIYPNPASGLIKADFTIKEAGNYTLSIYNSSGKKVREIFNKAYLSGTYEQEFNLENINSGQYYLVLSSYKYKSVKKLNIVK